MIELPYYPVTPEELARVDELQAGMRRRMEDVPEEGRFIEFRGHPFFVLPTVFWPHVDETGSVGSCTPILDYYTINLGEYVLDVGTGSGIIAIDAAKRGARRVVGIDINPNAVISARINAHKHNAIFGVDIKERDIGNILSIIPPGEKYDVVTANLPFRNKPASNASEVAIWDTDFSAHRDLFHRIDLFLKPAGRVYLAQANFGAVQEALQLAEQAGLEYRLLGHTAMATDEEQKTNPNYDPRVFYCFEMRRR